MIKKYKEPFMFMLVELFNNLVWQTPLHLKHTICVHVAYHPACIALIPSGQL